MAWTALLSLVTSLSPEAGAGSPGGAGGGGGPLPGGGGGGGGGGGPGAGGGKGGGGGGGGCVSCVGAEFAGESLITTPSVSVMIRSTRILRRLLAVGCCDRLSVC